MSSIEPPFGWQSKRRSIVWLQQIRVRVTFDVSRLTTSSPPLQHHRPSRRQSARPAHRGDLPRSPSLAGSGPPVTRLLQPVLPTPWRRRPAASLFSPPRCDLPRRRSRAISALYVADDAAVVPPSRAKGFTIGARVPISGVAIDDVPGTHALRFPETISTRSAARPRLLPSSDRPRCRALPSRPALTHHPIDHVHISPE